jgi:hypothetical protein
MKIIDKTIVCRFLILFETKKKMYKSRINKINDENLVPIIVNDDIANKQTKIKKSTFNLNIFFLFNTKLATNKDK